MSQTVKNDIRIKNFPNFHFNRAADTIVYALKA